MQRWVATPEGCLKENSENKQSYEFAVTYYVSFIFLE
jgi:hypothetical protein